jgi:hypothetical protein
MIPFELRIFLFMPWVFLFGISLGGKLGGVFGYFSCMGLIIAFYF